MNDVVERIAALLYEEATGEPWTVAGVEHPVPYRDYYRGLACEVAALAAQAPSPDARPGYAGVTVWVGDRVCTMVVPKWELEAARFDVLSEYFQKARQAVSEEDEQ